MAQLMLINPAKRPAKRRKATRSPAQKAATRRMLAARGLSSNPAPRRRRRRSTLRATASHARRRARRNPIGMTGIMGTITGAAIGAAGAVGINAVFGLLPVSLTGTLTGTTREVAKMALAVAAGMALKPMLGRNAGKMAEGAMTVSAYNILASFMPVSMGGTVAGLGYMSPGMVAGGYSQPNASLPNFAQPGMSGMGEYVSGLGEYVYQ